MNESTLDSASAVVKALGGPSKVGRMTKRTPQQVWNWTRQDRFPGSMYLLMQGALKACGKAAPGRLWGQIGMSGEIGAGE